jgi:hypothetical protein
MKEKKVLVFIEGEGGGGTTSKKKHLDGEFRKSWKSFLQPLADQAKSKGVVRFQCIPCRGGTSTAERFANPLPKDQGALRILLVDSEGPVKDVSKPWNAIKLRRPSWADDKSCYLMVQCLETWLLADVERLRLYYNCSKPCFRDTKLKAWPNLETIARKILQSALEAATAGCKNPYSHADGNLLIAVVDREKLKVLSSVERLFREFAEKIDEYVSE